MNDFDEVVLDEEEEISESERMMRTKKRKAEEQAKKAKEGLELLENYRKAENLFLKEPNKRDAACPYFKEFPLSYFDNCIGKRLNYLVKQRDMSISEIVSLAKIDRVNFYRIINGERVPRINTLLSLLDVLDISPYDFCYPINFEYWMDCAPTSIYDAPKDIFAVRDAVMSQLKGRFYYHQNGNKVVLSGRYYNVFMDAIENAFHILDLIPHDKTVAEKTGPKEPPVEDIE